MVLTIDPELVKSAALDFFHKSELPAGWDWVEALSPVNLRLFAVELADGVEEATITGDEAALAQLVADWRATAELDASPDVLAEVRREKSRSPLDKFVNA